MKAARSRCAEDSDLGGTMRLGEPVCVLNLVFRLTSGFTGDRIVRERHRHRYEVNNRYLDRLKPMAWWLLAGLRTELPGGDDRVTRPSLVYRTSVPP